MCTKYTHYFLLHQGLSLSSDHHITGFTTTAREIFKRHPKIRREQLWGGALWTAGFYANSVGLYTGKETIRRYIENQGKQDEYREIYSGQIDLEFNI
jgi:putative transposase